VPPAGPAAASAGRALPSSGRAAPRNTLLLVSSDEGDHEAGANVGRAIQPTPANCDGATVTGTTVTPDVACTYPAGSFGELAGNLTGLLATQTGNTTPFTLESDTAPEFYVTGNPGPDTSAVRGLERSVGSLTAANPYTGTTQKITNYLADPVEEGILHMVNADPAVESSSPGDASYLRTDKALSALERVRDRLAGEIKGELDAAAFSGTGVHDAAGQTVDCRALISAAERLAAGH
jgi:hypothetical protein